MKPFKLGIVVGRFQIFHAGHQKLIDYGLELCDKLVIYIGSSQESNTEKNPFDYEFRKKVIETIYKDKVEIRPLPDAGLGNNNSWGKYILDTVKNDFGEYPDLAISGTEDRRKSWFEDTGVSVSELIISKNDIPVSSTKIKEYLLNNDFYEYMVFVDSRLWQYMPTIKRKYREVLNNSTTESI